MWFDKALEAWWCHFDGPYLNVPGALSVDTLAERWGVSSETVRQLVKRGALAGPAMRRNISGTRRRFWKSAG